MQTMKIKYINFTIASRYLQISKSNNSKNFISNTYEM